MDFKHVTGDNKSDKNHTPKSEISLRKKLSRGLGDSRGDSPFRNLPAFSTPPSRFARIHNPFEPYIFDRLHLPTCSPTVFAQNSTPKTDEKFKWTIEDISNLKPADIDENTISQHVFNEDPKIESMVQEKISTFFSEKQIVPSPLHVQVNNEYLLKDCESFEESPRKLSEKNVNARTSAAQTVLTLPPNLPKELEDALKPYFNFTENQQQTSINDTVNSNDSLYKQLFGDDEQDRPDSCDGEQSQMSSPAKSTGDLCISPLSFSPGGMGFESPPELKNCTLSPIIRTSPRASHSRFSGSACRLDFSDKMSIDISMIVPDVENQQMSKENCFENDDASVSMKKSDTSSKTNLNWSMEYIQVSMASPSSSRDSDKMDVSNSNTPHSKLFAGKGQRKRLSESFKNEEFEADDKNTSVLQSEDVYQQNKKMFKNDTTDDGGYYTQETGDFSNEIASVFASTPSKRNAKLCL